MGCGGSKLAGDDDFENIDASLNQRTHRKAKKTASDPTQSSSNQETYIHPTSTIIADEIKPQEHKSPSFGSHAYMGTLPFTGKPRATKEKKKKRTQADFPPGGPGVSAHSIDGTAGGGAPRTLMLDGKVISSTTTANPASSESGRNTSFSTATLPWKSIPGAPETEEEYLASIGVEKPILRTDQDRMQPDPVTGKKPGLYQRYTNMRLGPGEERDPVTGKGKLTGMTKEEIIAYVQRTRGAGLYSGKQYAFVGAGEGTFNAM